MTNGEPIEESQDWVVSKDWDYEGGNPLYVLGKKDAAKAVAAVLNSLSDEPSVSFNIHAIPRIRGPEDLVVYELAMVSLPMLTGEPWRFENLGRYVDTLAELPNLQIQFNTDGSIWSIRGTIEAVKSYCLEHNMPLDCDVVAEVGAPVIE